jgi:prepilin-type N-terminal cleavage/methylation domain-containing protein
MLRKGFTLVELMTVVAIIAILAAILMPVIVGAKNYAEEYVAGGAIMKVGMAASMYTTDSDDTYPPAYYHDEFGIRQNWFGVVDGKGEVDPKTSLLHGYIQGKIQKDYAFDAKPWQGDEYGYGYNWGYLGSDFYVPGGRTDWYQCYNPAGSSELNHPSETVAFGTSVFYYAKWLPGGDGQNYRYGFIDPPKAWYGDPTLDFRHMKTSKKVDTRRHEVTSDGQALVVYADGHLKTLRQGQTKNRVFERGEWGDEQN